MAQQLGFLVDAKNREKVLAKQPKGVDLFRPDGASAVMSVHAKGKAIGLMCAQFGANEVNPDGYKHFKRVCLSMGEAIAQSAAA